MLLMGHSLKQEEVIAKRTILPIAMKRTVAASSSERESVFSNTTKPEQPAADSNFDRYLSLSIINEPNHLPPQPSRTRIKLVCKSEEMDQRK